MKNWKLKNLPLSRQILILFMLLTLLLGGSVGFLYPLTIKQYLVNNTYALLEEELKALSGHISFSEDRELLPFPASAPYFLQLLLSRYEFSFDVIVFSSDGQKLGERITERIPVEAYEGLYKVSSSYDGKRPQHGSLDIGKESYLFVSKKMDYHGFTYYMILFSKEREINQINTLLTRQFLLVFVIILAVSMLLAVWFSRYLSNPLRKLEESCQRIAKRQFDITLMVDREDEIGQLSRSFNAMKNHLQEYDESQRHFVQNISHELKTPIMAIQGYAQGLLDGVFQGPQAEKGLAIIMEESKRLEKVVEQLLYITKVESVSQMLQTSRVDLSEMFELIEQRLSVLNPQIAWDVRMPPTLPITADGEQLSVAFMNILENQLRYAKSRLIIRAQEVSSEVIITLANDGPPIEETLLPNLFQRFRKGKAGKHGLGLAIARAVMEAHKGTIQVENLPDGPRFTITLPQSHPTDH